MMLTVRRAAAAGTMATVFWLSLACAQTALHQTVPENRYFGTGAWNVDSLGTHRVVIRATHPSRLVRARIPWRRRDRHPAGAVLVDAKTGSKVSRVYWISLNRESADLLFEPVTSPGEYYVYYLLYRAVGSRNYPRGYYLPLEHSADTSWLVTARSAVHSGGGDITDAEVVQFQSIDEFNSFYPMEVVASAEEVAQLSATGAPFLLFPEERSKPIRMTGDLPYRWVEGRSRTTIEGVADRGEFFSFQIGLFACRAELRDVKVTMSDLRSGRGDRIAAPPFPCLNTGGTDWRGNVLRKALSVAKGRVQPLWIGIQITPQAVPGRYVGSVTVSALDVPPQTVRLTLEVTEKTIAAGGDDEPARMSRLRWLNSTLAIDDSVVRPYTPVTFKGNVASCLGRSMTLSRSGLPASVQSYFSPEVTGLTARPREMLAQPAAFVIEDKFGNAIPSKSGELKITRRAQGILCWRSASRAGPFDISLDGQLEFDGYADFRVTLKAREDASVHDIRLELPLVLDAMKYMMGMGVRGGYRPADFSWKWDVQKNQDAIWLGDVNAGLQISFRDSTYERPLNTNFYHSKPLKMPRSWDNGGRGGLSFSPIGGRTLLLKAFSGPRDIHRDEQLHFYFSFLITPFRTINTDAQWATRYYHRFAPLEEIAATGANTINVHHATEINPYINYPFLRPDTMRSYIARAHERGFKVKIYYTVRELSNHAPELFALRSLGTEVLADGPGGGFSWLQEHLDSNYIAGWFVPELKDAALITSGVSRWHNYFVEGLQWLAKNMCIDGLYIDDVAFDRTTMKRVRKVLERGRSSPLIDLHSANQFNPRDGFANSANLYLEHFPYIDRLWFGEYFDYDSPPEFWLVEVSGIPFGLMGEMLEKGGNPWRGMVYGMTARLPWAGDPRPLWKLWDDFGMQGCRMIGYWSPSVPVRTDNPQILATAYVRKTRTLIALASWASERKDCLLTFDWESLRCDRSRARLFAPAVENFQPERSFKIGEPIPLEPGKGWLLILSEAD